MTTLIRLLCLAALLLTGSAHADGNLPAPDREARLAWYEGILSGYQALARDTSSLAWAAQGYCQNPDQTGLEQVQKAWKQAFLAWQTVRFIDFGPVETDNRAWQFQFWPDPKNLVARKARGLLAAGNEVTPEQVAQAGVAVQGFPMVEYLLFDDSFRRSPQALPSAASCSLLTSVTGHIAGNSQQLLADWQDFRSHYLEAAPYRDTTIRAALAALEILEERRLAQPMGLRGTGKRSVYIADAWRSGSSLAAIEASVRGLQDYFYPGLAVLLRHSGQPELAASIEEQFAEVLAHFPELRQPMAPLLTSDDGYRLLQSLYVDMSQLSALIVDQAAATLGVVRGFNSSDGD